MSLTLTESLMDELKELQDFLNQHGAKVKLVDAYNYFVHNGTHGRNCPYAHKCTGMFMSERFDELSERINRISEIVKRIGLLDK